MTIRIMVVDDEPAIGKLLIYQLGCFGYQVSYVQDGLLALQRLSAERPDLVLLDVMMPVISGWELCRQIRSCSAVPVIMLTAKGADPDVVTGLEAGADDYITKPFSMAQLHARIEAVLRRSGRGAGAREATRRTFTPPQPAAPPEPALARTTAPTDAEQPPVAAAPVFRLGQHIRETRLARGFSLHQIERACKIRWEFLQAIEQENWSYVPRTQLRVALHAYTNYLGIDLPTLSGRSRRPRPQPLMPLHLAAALAVVMVLVVVGLYLL
jgi:DNA-binding response OmpR family regulator